MTVKTICFRDQKNFQLVFFTFFCPPKKGSNGTQHGLAGGAQAALEKAKRAAALQKQLQAQAAAQQASADLNKRPGRLLLDEFGREVDEHGKVLPMHNLKTATSTLRVNQDSEIVKKEKKKLANYVDPFLKVKKDDKKQEAWQRKRRFNFNEVGKFAAQEEKLLREKKEKKMEEKKGKKDALKEEATDENPNMMPLGGDPSQGKLDIR